jgi:hypothetical protein
MESESEIIKKTIMGLECKRDTVWWALSMREEGNGESSRE